MNKNDMKILRLAFILATYSIKPMACYAVTPEQVADAIWLVEGGAKTQHPYGIKSIKTKNPRQVCINTICNTFKRWVDAGRPGDFYDYLADRYCPKKSDLTGNINWYRNIKWILSHQKIAK